MNIIRMLRADTFFRKIRCDRLQPTCGEPENPSRYRRTWRCLTFADNCRSARAECTYEIEKDGRRAIPKTVAEALQHRVLALESLLAARGISFTENELLDLIDHNPDGFIKSGRLTPPGGRRLSWVHPMDAEEDENARAKDDVGPSDIGIDRLRVGFLFLSNFAMADQLSSKTANCGSMGHRPASL